MKPGRPAALEDLSFYIGRAYYNYKNLLERTLREMDLDRHLSPGMGHIFFALLENDDCIMRTIAERTRLSLPTITVMLERMKRAGLVRTRRDREDARAVRVKLTPRARSLVGRTQAVRAKINGVLESRLSRRQAAAVKRGLARIIEAMREHEAGPDARLGA